MAHACDEANPSDTDKTLVTSKPRSVLLALGVRYLKYYKKRLKAFALWCVACVLFLEWHSLGAPAKLKIPNMVSWLCWSYLKCIPRKYLPVRCCFQIWEPLSGSHCVQKSVLAWQSVPAVPCFPLVQKSMPPRWADLLITGQLSSQSMAEHGLSTKQIFWPFFLQSPQTLSCIFELFKRGLVSRHNAHFNVWKKIKNEPAHSCAKLRIGKLPDSLRNQSGSAKTFPLW